MISSKQNFQVYVVGHLIAISLMIILGLGFTDILEVLALVYIPMIVVRILRLEIFKRDLIVFGKLKELDGLPPDFHIVLSLWEWDFHKFIGRV